MDLRIAKKTKKSLRKFQFCGANNTALCKVYDKKREEKQILRKHKNNQLNLAGRTCQTAIVNSNKVILC